MMRAMDLAATLPDRLRHLGRVVIDGVLPPRCLACGETVGEPHSLCGRCWASMSFFAPPWCAVCGLPFPHPMGEGAVCADCARERASWDRARAVLRYDKHSRQLVLALKHGDRTHLAKALGAVLSIGFLALTLARRKAIAAALETPAPAAEVGGAAAAG
jgi:predicted amidophosphoribosyltransferase